VTVILSYIFYFVAASASPLQRRYLVTKRNADSSEQIHFAFQVAFLMAFLGLLIPFFQPFHLAGNSFHLILFALVCGAFGATYFISNYIAQKHVEAGITNVVVNIYTPVTIVLATFFLNERLSPLQIVGTVLLLAGMVLVSKKHRIGKFKFDKYFMLMVLSGVALGVSLVAERALQKTTGFTAGTLISWWSQCGALGIATLVTRAKSQYSKKDIAVTGVLRFLQSLSWVVLIFVVGNLSIVSAITTFKIVIIFIAAALFLKEREDLPRKTLGSIVALAGLLLMK